MQDKVIGLTDLGTIAETIRLAQFNNQAIACFTQRWRDFDCPAAYQVAELNHQHHVANGRTLIGRKIGFSNRLMWPIYGVNEPLWAYLYADTVEFLENNRATCALSGFSEPRIEPEIVVCFAAAPPAAAGPRELLACLDWVAHGIEIVQSHYPRWQFRAPDAIVDNTLHARLFIGDRIPVQRLGDDPLTALRQISVDLMRDGQLCQTGVGANVVGGPIDALAHLLFILANQADAAPLQAGELITTGSLTDAIPIGSGQSWSTRLSNKTLPGINVVMWD